MKKRCLALVLLCLLLPAQRAAGEWTADIVDSDWSPTQFVAVDKKSQSFALLVRQSPLRVARTIPCATGQELGDKFKEGDLKTPEGVYFISRRMNAGLNYDLYGDLAFVLNFPNPMDVLRHKSGHGIWIHGRGHAIIPYETQGCVALNTADIHRVDTDLAAGMPVIIADEIHIDSAKNPQMLKEGQEVVQATQAWAKAWENKSEAFFGFHDPEKFSITEGEPFASFKSHKERLFKALPWIKVTLSDVRAVAGPDYWVTYFIQVYQSPTLVSQGVKRLYWQRNPDGRFRIVGMEYEEMPVTLADKSGVKPAKSVALAQAEVEPSTPNPQGASEEETQVKQLLDSQRASVDKMAKKAFGNITIARQQYPTAEDEAILDVARSTGTGPTAASTATATDAMRQAPPPAAAPAHPAVVAAAAPAQTRPEPPALAGGAGVAHAAEAAQAPQPVQTAQASASAAPVAVPAVVKAEAPKPEAVTPEDEARIKAMVEAWRAAWEKGNVDAYAAFYAANARQGSLRGREAIAAQKRGLWQHKPPVVVEISDIVVTPRGQNGLTVQAVQHYQGKGSAKDAGYKTLQLVPAAGGYQIAAESWSHTIPKRPVQAKPAPAPAPVVAAAPQPTQPTQPTQPAQPTPPVASQAPVVAAKAAPAPAPTAPVAATQAKPTPQAPTVAAKSAFSESQAAATVESWRKAWEQGQIDAFMACYDASAVSSGRRGVNALRAQKAKLWETKPPKRVTLSDMRITPSGSGYTAEFNQDYESRDGSRHKGHKVLVLAPSADGLRITSEKWSRR